jgi:formate hydrogenlyase subunit 6/NADH:ubiquinone oxidoreductase subunit I
MVTKIKLPLILKEVVQQLFKHPATQLYPFVKPELPEGLRGRQIFDVDLCASCGLCAKDCPANAIEMVDVPGYPKKKPYFMLDRCIFCAQCADSCPKKAIQMSTFYELAGFSKSDLVVKPTPDFQYTPNTEAQSDDS